MTQVTSSVAELRKLIHGRVALVPTMGALHEGHFSLVDLAKQQAEQVVVSIFVNPTQFGPGEDYERYPRTLESDLAELEKRGVDIVFAPPVSVMYPDYPEPSLVTINAGPAAQALEGALRPGHFNGVCQVVAKLFNLVQPEVAVFGQKDAQQLTIIRQMVCDLNFPIEIIGGPIIREEDGLAKSSRNKYLDQKQRKDAVALSRALQAGVEEFDRGASQADIVEATYAQLAAFSSVEPEYAALATQNDFAVLNVKSVDQRLVGRNQTEDISQKVLVSHSPLYLLVAAKVGATRLIDNCLLENQ